MIKAAAGIVSSILVIGGAGMGAHKMLNTKVDVTTFEATKQQMEIKVAGALTEQAYDRYEEKIEEIESEQMYIKYNNATITEAEKEKLEMLDRRKQKYEKRQERLK